MMRLIIGVVFIAACGPNATQQKYAALNQKVQEAQEIGMWGPQASPDLTQHRERPLVAFVNNRPTWCNGSMCLEVTNGLNHPIAELTINGDRVPFARGAALMPRDRAYVRLLFPLQYTIGATVIDAVQDPRGRVTLQPVILERCSVMTYIPSPLAETLGKAMVHFDRSFCSAINR